MELEKEKLIPVITIQEMFSGGSMNFSSQEQATNINKEGETLLRPHIIGPIIEAGGGDSGFYVTQSGIHLGAVKFEEAPFRVDMEGRIYAKRLTLENYYDCEDPSITYHGTWRLEKVGTLYGGERKKSVTVGDYFEISFTGNAIGLIFEKAANLGKVDIYVDNVFLETIDLYSTSLFSRSIVWQKSDLTNGAHVLKGVVATKNPSSSGNGVGFQGYTLSPHPGIKMEQLSCDLYAYGTSLLTDANGYAASTISVPTGYSVYCIVGMRLSESVMSDSSLDDPKLAWRTTEFHLYNGAPDTTYSVTITLMLSKL